MREIKIATLRLAQLKEQDFSSPEDRRCLAADLPAVLIILCRSTSATVAAGRGGTAAT